jgi:hypothetical protein
MVFELGKIQTQTNLKPPFDIVLMEFPFGKLWNSLENEITLDKCWKALAKKIPSLLYKNGSAVLIMPCNFINYINPDSNKKFLSILESIYFLPPDLFLGEPQLPKLILILNNQKKCEFTNVIDFNHPDIVGNNDRSVFSPNKFIKKIALKNLSNISQSKSTKYSRNFNNYMQLKSYIQTLLRNYYPYVKTND